jgi:hypothetical protein
LLLGFLCLWFASGSWVSPGLLFGQEKQTGQNKEKSPPDDLKVFGVKGLLLYKAQIANVQNVRCKPLAPVQDAAFTVNKG